MIIQEHNNMEIMKPKSLSDKEQSEGQKTSKSVEKGEDISETIEEIIKLRKYRGKLQGIDAEKLSKGETKVKKKDDLIDEVQKKKIMLDSFALDADKHMMAYIEEGMRKRRDQKSDAKNGDNSGSR
ncbi:hypothetical protein C1645_876452 [Glomus cerebriforme]|uniref:Uncharacterized protein n=1 Tax=Glomus cerebriforme TaxID=658196 RepID=A0A397SW08_9GLOM|nr:hypothetical protein C1645_876452 [Glomus cerebriforme]